MQLCILFGDLKRQKEKGKQPLFCSSLCNLRKVAERTFYYLDLKKGGVRGDALGMERRRLFSLADLLFLKGTKMVEISRRPILSSATAIVNL